MVPAILAMLPSILAILLGVTEVAAVASPLDKVTVELEGVQTTVSKLQETLTTTLTGIQEKLSALDVKLSSVVEPRLASIDVTLTGMEARVTGMEERATSINEMQPHLISLRAQVTSLGLDLERVVRKEQGAEKQAGGSLVGKVEGVQQKVEEVDTKVDGMEARLVGLQESMEEQATLHTTLLGKVEREVKAIKKEKVQREQGVVGRGGRRHRRPANSTTCLRNRVILHRIEGRVKETLVAVRAREEQVEGPRFEYLRSEEGKAHYPGAPYNLPQDPTTTSTDTDAVGDAILRKIARPFKRVNSRIIELKTDLKMSTEDMKKDISDFLVSATEQQQEHVHMLEGQAAALASLSQCCSGVSSDQARLAAQAGPVLDRLDRWMTSWQNSVGQQFERVLQQNSYDHDSHSKGHKELERLLVEGFDRCQPETAGKVPRTVKNRERSNGVAKQNDEAKREREGASERTMVPQVAGVWESGCEEGRLRRSGTSKVYRVGTGGDDAYHTRYCDQEVEGGGWTVVQRRGDFGEPRENFTRSWEDYRQGFGDLEREFWWGNDKLSRLTTERPMVLRVELEAHDGQRASADYTTFRVDGEDTDYQLWIGGYSGNASDSLSAHNGYKFSTVDRNNDEAPKCCPCAPAYGGGWWFYSCFESNLNGEYFTVGEDNGYYRGIVWELWLGDYSLKSAVMMVRPQDMSSSTTSPSGTAPDP